MVVMGVSKACILARGGGAANRWAFHLLQGLVAADVGETPVAGAATSLGAVHGHVITTSQHFPRAEVAEDGRAHLWGPAVTLLGGMHHAVDITGAGRGAPGWWVRSFPVSADTEKRDSK